jgi:hypothetical protein
MLLGARGLLQPLLGGSSGGGSSSPLVEPPAEPPSPQPGQRSPAGGSPRKSRGRPSAMMAPLALPNSEELLVETGPPTDSVSFGLGSPQSAREIRARPIDIDKEIPLLFVDDATAEGGLTPTVSDAAVAAAVAAHAGNGPVPASRQNSGLGNFSLANALACSPSAALSTSVLPPDIGIPLCVAHPWEAPPVARRFRLPSNFVIYRPLTAHERVAEYELDAEDFGPR